MQPIFSFSHHVFIFAVLTLGCKSNTAPTVVNQKKQFEGISLTVSCQNAEIVKVLRPLAANWSSRTGAKINFDTSDSGDVKVVSSQAFAVACAKNEILPMLKEIRNPAHPLNLHGQSDAYYEGLAGWMGQPHGIVLGTDAAVMIYRRDLFEDASMKSSFKTTVGRDLNPPTSWEEAIEIANFFSKQFGKPSLAPLPSKPEQLIDLYNRIASCCDRPAITQSRMAGRKMDEIASESFSFHFMYRTAEPRLTSPGFAMAANLLAKLQANRLPETSGTSIEFLEKGASIFEVVSVSDLAKFKRGDDGALPDKFGITRVPGVREYYDNKTQKTETIKGNESNFIPYLSGGWIGCVPTKCQNPEAAYELLAEFGGPSGSVAIVSDPAIGSAPWRTQMIESEKKSIWLEYGLNRKQTENLISALKPYLILDVKNPVLGPRGPGIDKLMLTLEKHVRAAATGQIAAQEAMIKAQSEWMILESQLGRASDVSAWRKADMRSR